ncbi:MAG: hypothetical protein OXQ28_06145 [Acidobacteriota bacterium]|nr:hypothetical protein [Acidobacteriota bacterium]
MSNRQMEQRLENVEHRVDRNEQVLPTLATREDLKAAIAPLATKAELRAAIAPLATKAELRAAIAESEQRMRTHFDVVAESLRDDIRLVAEAVVTLSERVDRVS